MNRGKLERRTTLAARIASAYGRAFNQPASKELRTAGREFSRRLDTAAYRVVERATGRPLYPCDTRDDARETRRNVHSVETAIERRTAAGTYERIR